jgi:hypothetical protein
MAYGPVGKVGRPASSGVRAGHKGNLGPEENLPIQGPGKKITEGNLNVDLKEEQEFVGQIGEEMFRLHRPSWLGVAREWA